MSDNDDVEATPVSRRKVLYIIIGVIVSLVLVFVGAFIFDSQKSASVKNVNDSGPVVIDNEKVKPEMINMVNNSIDSVLSEGGEMNYFVNGVNTVLSVYNPLGVSGERAASYVSDESGGRYEVLNDEQNFTSTMMSEFIPNMDSTFTLWSWDGDKGQTSGYFVGDVGVECEPPAIGVKPNFDMCSKVVKSGIIVWVEDGVLVQVDNKVNPDNVTLRTVSYGVSQVVEGVLAETYK